MRLVKSLFRNTQHNIEYKLVKSAKRKTLSLQVRQGEVVVRSPSRLSKRAIDQFVCAKQSWIAQKVAEQLDNIAKKSLNFSSGQTLVYLGKDIPLEISSGKHTHVAFDNELITICLSHRTQKFISNAEQKSDKAKAAYFDWLKNQAQIVLPERVALLANRTNLKPSHIVIKRFKARWGSCNSKREISLNYLLMCCPFWVLDYVIIHELCHLVYMNHSRPFWQLVEVHCPEYKAAQAWLKANSIDTRQ